jgi:hypothetical protein
MSEDEACQLYRDIRSISEYYWWYICFSIRSEFFRRNYALRSYVLRELATKYVAAIDDDIYGVLQGPAINDSYGGGGVLRGRY